MITLWGRPNSINVQKVLWTLGELGLAYTHVDAGGDAGGLDEPAFRAMNPHGKVPVLKDGEAAIWEFEHDRPLPLRGLFAGRPLPDRRGRAGPSRVVDGLDLRLAATGDRRPLLGLLPHTGRATGRGAHLRV